MEAKLSRRSTLLISAMILSSFLVLALPVWAQELNGGNNLAFFSLRIGDRPPIPDLVVENVWCLQHHWAPGQTTAVNYRVVNAGPEGTATPATTARLYLSADRVLSVDDELVVEGTVGPLSSGVYEDNSLDVTVPDSTATATYLFVIVVADADGQVAEEYEDNNHNLFSLHVGTPSSSGYDLTVEKFSSPQHTVGSPSGTWSVPVRVLNMGQTTDSPETSLRFFLSTDPSYSADDIYLVDAHVPSLLPAGSNPGGFEDLEVVLSIENQVPDGFYYVAAFVDLAFSDGFESGDTNAWSDAQP